MESARHLTASDRLFPIANQQTEDCRIGAGFAANALGNFCDRNRGQRSFFRRLPNRGVATNRGERGVPRPDRDRKIKRGDDGDETERMPLLHQTMVRPFGLNRQAIQHARLADGEIADVDHLLHFAFAFGDNFSGLESDELAKFMFQFAERVSETANSVASDWTRRSPPFFERFLRAREGCLVIVVRRGSNTRQPSAIDRRDLVDLRAATAPFAAKDAVIVVNDAELSVDVKGGSAAPAAMPK